MDRGAWWATVHGVVESDRTEQLSTYANRFPKFYPVLSHLIIIVTL